MTLDASIQRRAFVLSTDGENAVGTSGSPIYFSLGLSGLNGSWTFNKEVAATISVAASTTTDTNGASLTITAAAGGATNSDGGALALDAGAKAGSGTDGAITIGTTAANAVTIGRSGKTTTVAGALAVTGATTLNGAVTLGDAAADDITFSGVVAGSVSLKKEGAHTISIAASTTSDTNGGALTITAGAGGATNSDGGALTIDAGAKAGSGTDGAITIGGTNANSVAIGRTGKTTTIPGALAVTQGSTLTGSVGVGGSAVASAILTVTSTTQGLRLPVMTEAQRDAIGSPAEGLIVYNTTTHKLNIRVAAAWEVVTSA